MAKLRFLFVLWSVNSFAMSMVQSLCVLSLCLFKTVRLLNRSWFILERSHVFSLRAAEKDLSPAALVAGFTRISLHNVITTFIICRFGLCSSLIFTMMSSKQKSSPSFSSTCKTSIWAVNTEILTSSFYSFSINFSSSDLSCDLRVLIAGFSVTPFKIDQIK